MKRIDYKGPEGTLGGDGNGHRLDCSGSFTNIYIYIYIHIYVDREIDMSNLIYMSKLIRLYIVNM